MWFHAAEFEAGKEGVQYAQSAGFERRVKDAHVPGFRPPCGLLLLGASPIPLHYFRDQRVRRFQFLPWCRRLTDHGGYLRADLVQVLLKYRLRRDRLIEEVVVGLG